MKKIVLIFLFCFIPFTASAFDAAVANAYRQKALELLYFKTDEILGVTGKKHRNPLPVKENMNFADLQVRNQQDASYWGAYIVHSSEGKPLSDVTNKKLKELFAKHAFDLTTYDANLFKKVMRNTIVNNRTAKNREQNLMDEKTRFLERQVERDLQETDQLMLRNSIEGLRGDLLNNELMQNRSTICQSLGSGTTYCY